MRVKTIGNKITLTCVVLVTFTVALAAAALIGIGALSADIQRLQADSIPGQYSIGRLEAFATTAALRMNGELLDLVTNSGNDAERTQRDFSASWSKYQDELKAYEQTITQAEARQLFSAIGPASNRYIQSWNQVRSLAGTSKLDDALRLYKSGTSQAFDELIKAIAGEVEWNHTAADQVAAASAAEAGAARRWNWVVSLIAVLAGSVLAFFVVRGINRALRRTVSELAEGAAQVACAARQVSASSQSLAQGSSQQAASLQETSASSEEIDSMARRNTENSQQAAHLVSGFQEKFGDASHSVDQMVVAMGDINAKRSERQDFEDHQGDRRDRVPDQHPGSERGDRGGAGRQRRARFRCGGG